MSGCLIPNGDETSLTVAKAMQFTIRRVAAPKTLSGTPYTLPDLDMLRIRRFGSGRS